MDLTRLPNLFLIGAPKAGTTTLYRLLEQYDAVYFPYQKEPSFFCDDEYYARGVEWYSEQFYSQGASFPWRGDATTRYLFWGSKVVPRIQTTYGSQLPKIIAIFRNPVDLAYSFYWQTLREGREELSFPDALAAEDDRYQANYEHLESHGRIYFLYTRIGFFARQLSFYLPHFPPQNRLFLLLDDLEDLPSLQEKFEGFLEIDDSASVRAVHSNPASLPRSRRLHRFLRGPSMMKSLLKPLLPPAIRHRLKNQLINLNLQPIHIPPMDAEIAASLREKFKPDIHQLEGILERDLSSWYSSL